MWVIICMLFYVSLIPSFLWLFLDWSRIPPHPAKGCLKLLLLDACRSAALRLESKLSDRILAVTLCILGPPASTHDQWILLQFIYLFILSLTTNHARKTLTGCLNTFQIFTWWLMGHGGVVAGTFASHLRNLRVLPTLRSFPPGTQVSSPSP